MTLPNDFIFTQNNLQDYEDCPRRFELRHLLHLAWPAPQTEPVLEHERHMLQGEHFHRLAQQHFLGLPAELLLSQAKDPELAAWWETFLGEPLVQNIPAQRWPEVTLSMPFASFRLLCKLDLLTRSDDGRFTILDWKTGPNRTPHNILAERWQTRLYPYILQKAASSLNGGQPLAAEQIEMIYWFAADSSHPQHFQISEQDLKETETLLHMRISQIMNTVPGRFFLTTDERRCSYCVYRSLCERGEPGSLADAQADFESPDTTAGLELDQIGEVSL
jgi:hypothetical protein